MDNTPKKLAFLRAVVGTDGADALAKTASRAPELEGAIYPRALMAWLELLAEFEGDLPGTDARASFRKSEEGYEGFVKVGNDHYDFKGVDIYHLAGSVAVALGANDEPIRTNASPALLNKLGKQLDVLVKSRFARELIEQEGLAKTSWNVKMRRRYEFEPGATEPKKYPNGRPERLSAAMVEDRRRRYAQGIGLQPQYGSGAGFPQAQGNKVPYNTTFDIEHETAHAMMTPDGQTLPEYQKWLTSHASEPDEGVDEDAYQDDLDTYNEASHHENVANMIEPKIDRRAGVDPHLYQGEYRNNMKGTDEESHYHDKSGSVVSNPAPNHYATAKAPIVADHIREDAAYHVKRWDAGAKFNSQGAVVPPKGIDARVNERAAGARPRTPFVKDEIKTGKPKVQLPGQTAKPNAPSAPTPPTPKAPKPTAPQMGATSPSKPGSTSVPKPATAAPAAKPALPGAAKPAAGAPQPPKPKMPGATVTKSEARTKCSICGGYQFIGPRFLGCLCFHELSKSVTVKEEKDVFKLSFGADWDADAIASLIGSMRK